MTTKTPKILTLTGKNTRGRQIVRDHGTEWTVIRVINSPIFTKFTALVQTTSLTRTILTLKGPWWYIKPKGLHSHQAPRWFHPKKDRVLGVISRE